MDREDARVGHAAKSRYRIQMSKKTGEVIDMQDPYAAPSMFSEWIGVSLTDRVLLPAG